MIKKYYMNRKKLLIILLLAAAIILLIASINVLKSDVTVDVHGEHIPNTDDTYIVCKILDSNGNIADTSIGKLSIEFQYEDENAAGSVIVPLPLENGISVIRENNVSGDVKIYYDGGYFYNPCEYSGKLTIKNTTSLTDENITSPF